MPWLKTKLVQRPYYDPRTGRVLKTIEGRRNRKGVDEFRGGGKVYPEHLLKHLKIMERVETGCTLMVLVDEPQEKIDAEKARSGSVFYNASPREVKSVRLSEFETTQMTDAGALAEIKKLIPGDVTMNPDGTINYPDKGE